MDMLNSFPKKVAGEHEEMRDEEMQRQIQEAFPTQESVTPAPLLLERLMAQAEASPQLAAFDADSSAEVEMPAMENAPAPRQKNWWTRLVRPVARRHAASKARPASVWRVSRDLYRERVEYHMRQVTSGNWIKPQ